MQDCRVHFRLEKAERRAAGCLGPVERHISPAQQLHDRIAIVRKNGDADARADSDLPGTDQKRLLHPVQHPPRNAGRRILVGQHAGNDGKFIAAQPGDKPALADSLGQASGELLEQKIAKAVAIDVVHRLEAVDIQHDDGAELIRLHHVHHGWKHHLDMTPVRQAGQRIMLSLSLRFRQRGICFLKGVGQLVFLERCSGPRSGNSAEKSRQDDHDGVGPALRLIGNGRRGNQGHSKQNGRYNYR